MLAGDGVSTDSYLYDAFGEPLSHTGSSTSPYTFVGRQGYYFDEETGLYLAGLRHYNSSLGRWLSPDPLGQFDSTNRYLYINNSPLAGVDPLGLFITTDLTQPPTEAESWLPAWGSASDGTLRFRARLFC